MERMGASLGLFAEAIVEVARHNPLATITLEPGHPGTWWVSSESYEGLGLAPICVDLRDHPLSWTLGELPSFCSPVGEHRSATPN